MAELVICPKCSKRFDRDMVKDSFAICPYCEEEVEVPTMTREEALSRYDRIRYNLLNHDDKVAVDIAFNALRGDANG